MCFSLYITVRSCAVTSESLLKQLNHFIGKPVGWHVVEDRESVKRCCLRYTMRVGLGGSKLEHTLLTV